MNLFCAQANSALDAAPDHLTNLADQTTFPNDRTIYLETMHELGFNKKAVVDKFEESMGHAFDALTGDSYQVKVGGVDTSNIAGISDLEGKLALETMTNKARTRTELPLHSIIRSINGMMGDDWIQHNVNPFDPEYMIKAWLIAIQTMQLTAKGNLAMYGLFDDKVLYVLPRMYENISSFLEKLPKARQSILQSARHDQAKALIGDKKTDYEEAFGDIDGSAEIPNFDSVSLTSESTEDFEAQHEGEPLPERRTDELVDLLDRLQRNREIDDSQYYDSNYLLNLRGLLVAYNAVPEGEINSWTIGQINDDVVDMTELMFSFIMEDVHLPEDIRYHIARLQIPYLKLGLQDKSIFVNKEHPARQLLNDLSQSISLWDPTHSGGLDMLLTETISVIDSILNDYRTDTKLFVLIQEQFSRFLSGDTHIDEGMEQRQKNTASKTVKADNARLLIESTLHTLCENKRIPPVINQILDDFWTKVLFLEYLKSGEDSNDFSMFIETAEMLIDSVQPKASELSRKSMAKLLPVLIKRLKAGLTTISVASFETVDVFRELQECHMLVLKERPELEADYELEVSDDAYEEFKEEQNIITQWDRSELENALLEESIERSLSRSDDDAFAFEDNRNIISSKESMSIDASIAQATRERNIIDNELKEARDAYERALKDHQEKKGEPEDADADDYMAQFFQDPEFIEKQYAGSRDLSSETDPHLQTNNEDIIIDANIFEEIEEISVFPPSPEPYEIDVEQDANIQKSMEDPSDVVGYIQPEGNDTESRIHSNDELDGRAHGALEEGDFSELGDEQVTELIERLKVGLWVDMLHADGNLVRAKIMAIVPTVGKYIFGDRSGRKLADYNKQSLADALRTGQIRVSEEDNVFDKTLESVIANLRIMKKAEDD